MTATWIDTLPTLDGLQPVFDELAGHEVDAAREWVGDRKHVRRTDRSVLLDPAGRQRISRAYRSLAAAGLIERIGDVKTSAVALTERGQAIAKTLAGKETA